MNETVSVIDQSQCQASTVVVVVVVVDSGDRRGLRNIVFVNVALLIELLSFVLASLNGTLEEITVVEERCHGVVVAWHRVRDQAGIDVRVTDGHGGYEHLGGLDHGVVRLVQVLFGAQQDNGVRQAYHGSKSAHRVRERALHPRATVRVLADFHGGSLDDWNVLRSARDEEDDTVTEGHVSHEVERLSQQRHRALQIDNVGVDTCSEYVLVHPGTTEASVVTVVASGPLEGEGEAREEHDGIEGDSVGRTAIQRTHLNSSSSLTIWFSWKKSSSCNGLMILSSP